MARSDGKGARAWPIRADESLHADLPRAATHPAGDPARSCGGRPAARTYGSATLYEPEPVDALRGRPAGSASIIAAAAPPRRRGAASMGPGSHRPAYVVAVAQSIAVRWGAQP